MGSRQKQSVFFSEEKNQKTFMLRSGVKIPAMAGNLGAAQK
jgi:hypothetical protein